MAYQEEKPIDEWLANSTNIVQVSSFSAIFTVVGRSDKGRYSPPFFADFQYFHLS
jgi:hypothetical protein